MGEVPRGCSCSPPGPAGEGEEGAASLGWGRTHPGAASAFPRGQAQREYGTDASPSPSPRPPWRQRRREWAPATPGRKPGLWGPMTPIRSSSLESERREKSEHDRVMRIIATSINDDYRSLGGAGRRHPCGWERGDAPCTMHHAPSGAGWGPVTNRGIFQNMRGTGQVETLYIRTFQRQLSPSRTSQENPRQWDSKLTALSVHEDGVDVLAPVLLLETASVERPRCSGSRAPRRSGPAASESAASDPNPGPASDQPGR